MMAGKPNVILLTIDALRADHVGYEGYERVTTPFLDTFAEENISFKTAISASSHTREAMPALLTGYYPDIFAGNGYRCVTETIADRLSEAGYDTGGFHSNPYLSRAYEFNRGYDRFYDDLKWGQNRFTALAQRALEKFLLNRGEYHTRAEDINRLSLEWVDSLEDGPFYLWNHYMDVHGPYNPPAKYDLFSDEPLSNQAAHNLYQRSIKRPESVTMKERDQLRASYDGEIAYLDSKIRELISALEKRRLLQETIVIITADHGDAFGEHGYFTHPRYLHEPLLHVPLFLMTPDRDGSRVGRPVSLLDVVPTILDLVGLNSAGLDLPGKSLLDSDSSSAETGPVFAGAQGEDENRRIRHFAGRTDRWKLHLSRSNETEEIRRMEAFDLENDPGEKSPIAPRTIDDREFEELRSALTTHSQARLRAMDGGELEPASVPTKEIDERLEALGYK